jgi:hypothetical protein
MTVHMIQFVCAPDADSFLIDHWLPSWLTAHTAWEDPHSDDNQPPERREIAREQEAYVAEWRFDWGNNSRAVLLDNLVGFTQAYASWYWIGYHECQHDQPESATRDCPPWDDSHPAVSIRTGGAVPEGV